MLPLSEADERQLLELARRSIEQSNAEPPGEESCPAALRQPAGAFVSLHKHGRLRGCVGHIEAQTPLFQTVWECASAAAFRDPRFDPVCPVEFPDLRIEISVLSDLTSVPIDQIEVGRHGLLITAGWKRGLLLPQVAVQWKWDRERFLEETCLKAGLANDAWRHGATVQVFTALVFGEPKERDLPTPHREPAPRSRNSQTS
jgi:AmmeMemoRadiSam system protein A